MDTTALTAPLPTDVDPLPVPAFGGKAMRAAFLAYRDLQATLDDVMPDQIMEIEGRAFRKKGYWRAVAVAFSLDVEIVEERDAVRGAFHDGKDNFGYHVTCRASTKTGRTAVGDGSCFAIEKAARFRCPHPHASWEGKSLHYPHETCPDYDDEFRWRALPPQASEHNVRSHAVTRAINRAVSNLVGFGEVSAEEVERSDEPPPLARRTTTAPTTITDPQRKRLWAIAKEHGWTEPEVRALLGRHGFSRTEEITREQYDGICQTLKTGDDGEKGRA